jgi:predicted dienelactone hydrolase
LLVVLGLLCSLARATTGLAEWPGTDGVGPITLFYPTAGAPQPVKRGPFAVTVARDGAPERGNGRLIVISHGSGGSPWTYTDLAFALVEAGFTVAAPEHRGDSYRDRSAVGPESWKRRPAEISRAIDAVARDVRFARTVMTDKVGVYGMSAGGHTALSLAGGHWSPATFARHCETNIGDDFPACAGLATRLQGDLFDPMKKWAVAWTLRLRFTDVTWQKHRDARVRAIVAAVPYAADFDLGSLAAPPVPLGIVRAAQDKWLTPRFHSDAVLQACRTCEKLVDLPTGGHGAPLSPLPPDLPEPAASLLNDPPGFDRPAATAQINRSVVAFFRKHLLP